jgi:hypothetical protein
MKGFRTGVHQKEKGAEAPFSFTNHQLNSVNLPKTDRLALVIGVNNHYKSIK